MLIANIVDTLLHYNLPGSVFFHLHTPGYKVVKQTVLTDIFEMKGFKPVVRLQIGDQVRTIGFPKREPTSGLVRVKATTVGHKTGRRILFIGRSTCALISFVADCPPLPEKYLVLPILVLGPPHSAVCPRPPLT